LGAVNDPDELARTLEKGLLAIPDTYSVSNDSVYGLFELERKKAAKIPPAVKMPLVIYLHGCDGLSGGDQQIIFFLLQNDYAVLAPNRFARKYKPKSCHPKTRRAGLFRGVLQFRLAEARYAFEKAQVLPWVDKHNIFIMGFSEGGVTTAKYSYGGLAGRIILGWTCHAGWIEYQGLAGPKDEPILSIVADNDPWYTRPLNAGDCGKWMQNRKNCESLVMKADSPTHHVLWLPGVQSRILRFLDVNRRP